MGQNALVVSEDFVRRQRWASWLQGEGFETATCAGPHVIDGCPRLDGLMCPLREWAEVAVVEVSPGHHTELYGGRAELHCTTVPDDHRTVFLYRPGQEDIAPHVRHAIGGLPDRVTIVKVARRASSRI